MRPPEARSLPFSVMASCFERHVRLVRRRGFVHVSDATHRALDDTFECVPRKLEDELSPEDYDQTMAMLAEVCGTIHCSQFCSQCPLLVLLILVPPCWFSRSWVSRRPILCTVPRSQKAMVAEEVVTKQWWIRDMPRRHEARRCGSESRPLDCPQRQSLGVAFESCFGSDLCFARRLSCT